jgi:hypothetical protein
VVSLTPYRFARREREPIFVRVRGWVGPIAGLGSLEAMKSVLTLLRIEP